MILFKACTRCGGDVDMTYGDDVYCVQCSHRPDVAHPGPRVISASAKGPIAAVPTQAPGSPRYQPASQAVGESSAGAVATSPCPRCGSKELIRLDRLRERDNFCYRCRLCGHIFSPAHGEGQRRRQATVP